MQNFNTTGGSLRDLLSRRIGEYKRDILRLVEARGIELLNTYLAGLGLAASVSSTQALVRAIFQGGEVAKEKIRDFAQKTAELNAAELAKFIDDIYVHFGDLRAKLNSSRFTANAVAAHLEKLDLSSMEHLLNDLQASNKARLLQIVRELIGFRLEDLESLDLWLENCHELLSQTSQQFPDSNKEQKSSRLKKGFISQKNLPQYLKAWKNFVYEIYKYDFNVDLNLDESYKTLHSIKQELEDRSYVSKINIIKTSQHIITNTKRIPIIKRTFTIDDAAIVITYSENVLNPSNIEFLLKNLEIQRKINPSQKTENTSFEIDNNTISIEINGSKNINMDSLRYLLESLI